MSQTEKTEKQEEEKPHYREATPEEEKEYANAKCRICKDDGVDVGLLELNPGDFLQQLCEPNRRSC